MTLSEMIEALERPFTTPEIAAKIFNSHTETMRRAIKRGDLEAVRIGRRLMIPTSQIRRKVGLADNLVGQQTK